VLCYGVERKSSPGFPLNTLSNENNRLLEHYYFVIKEAVVERLNLLLNFNCDVTNPVELVRMGLCDPIKLFGKDEPHKQAKIVEGRLRLIFSVGLVDNIIARLLFTAQNKAEIESYQHIPVKPGMGGSDEQLFQMYQTVCQNADIDGRLNEIMEVDVKGWDFSVQEFDFNADLERRINLNNSRGTCWERIARAHYHCMTRKVVVCSDSLMFKQSIPGVMPSGWYNTSSSNSSIRVMNAYHIQLEQAPSRKCWCIAMGDDTVERHVPDAEFMYERLGKTCGLLNKVTVGKFEFCSTEFTDTQLGYPVNVDKQLFNLLNYVAPSHSDGLSRWEQFKYEIRHHPKYDDLVEVVLLSGWLDTIPAPALFTL